jgi:hypothetical protein
MGRAVTVAIGRASQAQRVHASKLAFARSFVFGTSAHLPFPTAVIRRYLLAAIDMTVLAAENKVRPGRADPHCGAGALAVSGTNRRGDRVVALAQRD